MGGRGRPQKYSEPLDQSKTLWLTKSQKAKLVAMDNGDDYLRECIELRDTGTQQEQLLRARSMREEGNELIAKAEAIEAQVKEVVDSEDDRVDKIVEEAERFGVFDRPRGMMRGWLMESCNNDVGLFEKVLKSKFPDGIDDEGVEWG